MNDKEQNKQPEPEESVRKFFYSLGYEVMEDALNEIYMISQKAKQLNTLSSLTEAINDIIDISWVFVDLGDE